MKTKPGYTIIAIATTMMLLLMLAAPPLSDDYWYQRYFPSHTDHPATDDNYLFEQFANCREPKITTLSQALKSICHHTLYWHNARTANNIAFPTNLLPHTAVDCLHALFYLMMLILTARLVTPKYPHTAATTTIIAWSLYYIIPYNNQMLSSVFQINYIWTTALNLLLLNQLKTNPRKPTTTALAILSATMHEGFSVPITTALIAAYIYRRRHHLPTKQYHRPAIAYAIATLLITLNPAVIKRFIVTSPLTTPQPYGPITITIKNFIIDTPIIPVTLLLLTTILLTARRHRPTLNTTTTMMTAIIITSTLIAIATKHTIRGFVPAAVTLGIIDPKIIAAHLQRHPMPRPVTTAITLLFTTWLTTLIVVQNQARTEMQTLIATLNKPHTNPLYIDLKQPGTTPWWLNQIPEFYAAATTPYIPMLLYTGTTQQNYNNLVILPAALATTPFDSLPPIKGNTPLRGTPPYLYSPQPLSPDSKPYQIQLTYGPVNPRLSTSPLQHLILKLRRHSDGTTKAVTPMTEIKIPVTDAMRQQGLSQRDTIYFYRTDQTSQTDLHCHLLRADYI